MVKKDLFDVKERPNPILLWGCRAIILALPLSFTLYMIAVAGNAPETIDTWGVCVILSVWCILLYESLYREQVIYEESLKDE